MTRATEVQPPAQPVLPGDSSPAATKSVGPSKPGMVLDNPRQLLPVARQDADLKLRPVPLAPIEAWLFDGTNNHLNAKSILAALQGQSTLGDRLKDDNDKRRLLDLALGNFSHVAVDKIEELAVLARNPRIDPKVRRMVAEQLLQRAVDPGPAVENPRAQARADAFNFLRTMRDDPLGRSELLSELSPQAGFRLARAFGNEPLPDTRLPTSCSEGSQDDRRFAERDPRLNDPRLLTDARNQILAGLPALAGTSAARSPAITAIVYGLADEITPAEITADEISAGALHPAPPLAHSLAVALADQWDPRHPPVERLEALLTSQAGASLLCTGSPDWKAAAREAVRLTPQLTAARLEHRGDDPKRDPEVAYAVAVRLVVGVHSQQARAATPEENAEAEPIARALQTRSGHKLLFDERVSKADRCMVLQIMLADRGQKLTRAAFESAGDAWQIPAIAGPFARRSLENFKDGDFSLLPPTARKNLIGLSLGIAPNMAGTKATAKDIESTGKALAEGRIPPFLTENDFYRNNEPVEKIASKFVNAPGFGVEHVMLFGEGPTAVPLFKGRELDGTEFLIDEAGNKYKATFPQDENYRVHPVTAFQNFLDSNPLAEGTVYFQGHGFKTSPPGHRETPAARDASRKIWHHTAQVATGAAMAAAVVGTDGLAGAAFGFIGLAGAGYLAVDEGRHLAWLNAHGHDVNPFTNPDQAVIAAWVGMAANAAGPFAALGGVAFRGLAKILQAGAKGVNLFALGDAFLQMALHPERVTVSDLVQNAFFAWMSLRHAPPRPAAETAGPPQVAASAPPAAELFPPAPTSLAAGPPTTAAPAPPGPTVVTPPTPHLILPMRPTTPEPLPGFVPTGAPGHGQPGQRPMHVGDAPGRSPPNPRNRRPAPANPNTRQLAGNRGDQPPGAEPAPPHSPGAAPAAANLPGGIAGEVTRLDGKIASLEARLEEPNLPAAERGSLGSELAAAREALKAALVEQNRYVNELVELAWDIGHLEDSKRALERVMIDPTNSMDERVAVSGRRAKLLEDLERLKKRQDELAKTLNGPDFNLPDRAPTGPVEQMAAPVGAANNVRPISELGRIKMQAAEAQAKMREIDDKLDSTHLSRAERVQLLTERDVASNDFGRLSHQEWETTSEIARKNYEDFRTKNQHRPMSQPEFERYARVGIRYLRQQGLLPEGRINSNEPTPALLAAVERGMKRIDSELVTYTGEYYEVLDSGASSEAVETANHNLEEVMKVKAALKELAAQWHEQLADEASFN